MEGSFYSKIGTDLYCDFSLSDELLLLEEEDELDELLSFLTILGKTSLLSSID
jgi:hypothetical protein